MNTFQVAISITLVLPTFLLGLLWKQKALRKDLLLFLVLIFIQIGLERYLARSGYAHWINYEALAFVSFRLFQVYQFRKHLTTVRMMIPWHRTFCYFVFFSNVILWIAIWSRLILKIANS